MKTQSLDAFLIIGMKRAREARRRYCISTHVYEEDANTENETNSAGQTIKPRRRETGTKWR
jgi:hypothetical protein